MPVTIPKELVMVRKEVKGLVYGKPVSIVFEAFTKDRWGMLNTVGERQLT